MCWVNGYSWLVSKLANLQANISLATATANFSMGLDYFLAPNSYEN